jgi:hypothetical protein
MASYVDLFKQLRSKFPKANIPSGVAAATALDKIKNALDQKDSGRKSQVLPQFANMTSQILSIFGIMGLGSSAFSGISKGSASYNPSGGSSSGGGCDQVLSSDVTTNIATSLSNSLAVMAQKYGLQAVVAAITAVLNNATNSDMSPDELQIIQQAAQQLQSTLDNTTLENYPIIIAPPVVIGGDPAPSPLVNITTIGDFYAEQYYASGQNPYPGYVAWMSVTGDLVYTIRTADYPPFESTEQAAMYYTQQSLISQLNALFSSAAMTLSSLLTAVDNGAETYVSCIHTVAIGKGASNQPAGGNKNSSNLVAMLLPILNSLIQDAQSDHLPKSVLNQGVIQQLLNKHSDACSKAKMIVNLTKQAIQPGGGAGGGGVSGILGSLGKI